MKYIIEGYVPHMLDVAHISKQARDLVSVETTYRCWSKADVVPIGKCADIVTVNTAIRFRYLINSLDC